MRQTETLRTVTLVAFTKEIFTRVTIKVVQHELVSHNWSDSCVQHIIYINVWVFSEWKIPIESTEIVENYF